MTAIRTRDIPDNFGMGRANPRRRPVARLADAGWFSLGSLLSASAALGIPLVLHLAGLAALNRPLYPLMAIILGGVLYRARSPWYLGYCIWLFCACSLVRRLTDYQLGFQPSSMILLAPYLACCFGAISAFRYLGTGRNICTIPFLLIFGTTLYGVVLAVLQGRMELGLTDAMKWSAGPLMAVHLLSVGALTPAHRRVAINALVIAGPLMAIYGTLQFINPSPWDASWLNNIRLMGVDSMGVGLPFSLRVFGTMQSAGSQAVYLAVAIILLVNRPLPVAIPGIVACALGLALCQYRTLWGATCLGLVLLCLWGTAYDRMRVALGAAALVLCLGSLATIPEMQEALLKRFNSIGELQSDASGAERLSQYARFFIGSPDVLMGTGLGMNYIAAQSGQATVFFDSGVLDTIRSLGLFGGLMYLGALATLLVRSYRRSTEIGGSPHVFCAVATICFIQLPLGSIHTAEAGFLGWLFLGLALGFTRPVQNALTGQQP